MKSAKKKTKVAKFPARKARLAVLNSAVNTHSTTRLMMGVAALPFLLTFASAAKADTIAETDLNNSTVGYTTGYTIGANDVLQNSIVAGSSYDQILSGSGGVNVVYVGGEGGTSWILGAQNTYTGETNIAVGATLEASTTNIIAQSNGVNVYGTFETSGYDQELIDLGGDGTIQLSYGSCAAATLVLNIMDGSTWSGVISDADGDLPGHVIIRNGGEGTGDTIVFDSSNTYTGDTTIESGATLRANANNVIQTSSSVTVDGTFDVYGTTQSINNLGGEGSIRLSGSSASGTLNVNINGNTTWSGVISDGTTDAGSVNFQGSSSSLVLTLANQNTYTGATSIGLDAHVAASTSNVFANSFSVTVDGTFDANGNDQTINNLGGEGLINLSQATNASTLTINAYNSTWDGVIANGGEAEADGNVIFASGTSGSSITLGGQNTYTGTTTIQNGVTVIADTTNVIADSIGVEIDGVFNANGYNQLLNDLSGTGSIALSSGSTGSTLTVNVANSTTWSGDIYNGGEGAAAGNLIVTGSEGGIWTVSSTQSYTGTTNIQSGAIVNAGNSNIFTNSSAVQVGGLFDANGHDQTLHNLSGAGDIHLSNGSDTSTLTIDLTSDTTWGGVISNGGEGASSGNVIIGGEGHTLTLAGQNTYTGTTSIQSGTTVVADNTNVIASSIGVDIDGVFNANGFNQILNDVSGDGSILLSNSSTSGTVTINILNGTTWDGQIQDGGSAAGNLVISSQSSGGIWTVTQQFDHTGTTTINEGAILQANAADMLDNNSSAIIDGTLRSIYDQSINDLGGEGSIVLSNISSGGGTVTLNIVQGSVWDGVISNGGEGTTNLVITSDSASSILTLGNQNTFNGTTEIREDAQVVATASNVIAQSSEVTIDGIFNANGNDQTFFDLGGEGSILLSAGSDSSTLTVSLVDGSDWYGVISDGGSAGGNLVISSENEAQTWNVYSQQNYTGTTDIESNVSVRAHTNNIMSNSIGMNVDGDFNMNGYDQTLNDLSGEGYITYNSSSEGATLTVNIVNNSSWGGEIDNTNSNDQLVITGSNNAILTLTEDSNFSGTVDIDEGARVLAEDGHIFSDAYQVIIDGEFNANGYNQTFHDLGGEGSILLASASDGANLNLYIDNGSTWAGVIANGMGGEGNNVNIYGGEGENSVLVLANSNTYTGATTIYEGARVRAEHDDVFADSSNVQINGVFDVNGYDQSINGLGGEGLINLSSGSESGTLTINIGTNNTSWDGIIANGGEGAVAGNVIISGGEGTFGINNQQAYTGTTTINSNADVDLYDVNILANSSRVTVRGELDTNGYDQTLNDLGGEGYVLLGNGSNSATLTVNVSNNITWDGVLVGDGDLIVTSGSEGAIWTLGGENIHTGTTEIREGAIVHADAVNVLADSVGVTINGLFDANDNDQLFTDLNGDGEIQMGEGDLTLNGLNDTEFSGVIGGTGTISFIGEYVTRLTGINTNTGDATVEFGTLTVDGTVSNENLTVDDGATLKGSGTLTGNLINNGVVAPGNSPGTLTVGGNYSGVGVLEQEITGSNAPSDFDRLIISGTADLSGQTVDYIPLAAAPAASYVRGTQYVYLEAAGGLGGTEFANAAENSVITATDLAGASIAASPAPALAIRTNYTNETVTATIVRTQFFALNAQTYNQSSVGTFLDPLQLTNSDPDMDVVLNAIDQLTPAQQAVALDQLSGSISAELLTGAQDMQRRFDGMVGKRLGGDCNKMGDETVVNGKGNGAAWACAYGDKGQIDADNGSNSNKLDNRKVGLAAGYEFKPGNQEATTVRVGIGYGHGTMKQSGLASSADMDTYQLGAYAQHNLAGNAKGGAYVGGGLAGSYNTTDTTRNITFGGLNRRAEGEVDGYNFAASAVLGYEAYAGRVRIEPVAGLEYVYTKQNSFTETGAGAANLSFNDEDVNSLRTSIGAQASSKFTLGNGMTITPEGRAAFIYDAMTVRPDIDAAFVGAGSTFNVRGVDPGRAGVQGGAGVTLDLREDLSVFADYTATVKENSTNNSVMGGLKYRW